jgi:hypothetical protein
MVKSAWGRSFAVMSVSVLASGFLAGPAGAVQIAQAAPVIAGISPGSGSPGDLIEITGDHLVVSGERPRVTFLNRYEGTLLQFSESIILVVVPTIPDPPADGRPIELRVTTSAGSDARAFRYSAPSLGAPVGLKATALRGKVRLRWMPPASGASSVTSYQWSFALAGTDRQSKWKTVAQGAKARKQTVKRIRPGRDYVFFVRAMAGTEAGVPASVIARGQR